MAGLQVYVQNNDRSIRNISSFGDIMVGVTSGVQIYTVGAPQELNTIVPYPFNTTDGKVYLRQNKKDYFVRNNSVPGWLRLVFFRVRRSAALANYATWLNLLGDQNITLSNWAAPLTTGNPAQRYLKFTKTKLKLLKQGACYHFKVNLKFKSPRAISQDVEVDTTQLGTRITRGVIMQWIPAPVVNINDGANPTSYTGMRPAPYELEILEQEYVSYYNLGENDPTVQMTSLVSPTGVLANQMLPGYQKWDPHIN